jgi:hypothetical protein
MELKRIFLPEMAAKQLQALPAATRFHVEAYLENLDVHLATAPHERFVERLERADEGFTADVQGAGIFFTVDIGLRIAFIRRISVS